METRKIILIFILSSLSISLYYCKPEEKTLTGEISGIVTDTTTSQPLQAVTINLIPANSTTTTGIDGKYQFLNLNPDDYKIEASKLPYVKSTRSVTVNSGGKCVVNFALRRIPYPRYSTKHLDFGLDSTKKFFTIKNTGTGKLTYDITPGQTWITVHPASGEATTETDTVMVTINRNGLSKAKFTEIIEINSHVGQDIIKDSVGVYLNGIFDERDSTYYGIVKIGSQTWLSENLKIGTTIYVYNSPADSSRNDGTVDKYCYDNLLSNCDVYGGFYQWVEMMQYNPPDTGLIGTTQGICMDGWHLPTFKEWETLFYFLGGHKEAGMAGYFDVGDKLKESGSTHWKVPNSGATNESGFTAIPGGNLTANSEADWSQNHWTFKGAGSGGYWMSASRNLGIQIMHSTDNHVADVINWIPMQIAAGNKPYAGSVRCIKNPSKNR